MAVLSVVGKGNNGALDSGFSRCFSRAKMGRSSVAVAVAVGRLQLKPVSSYSRSRFQFFSGNGRLPSNRKVGW